MRLQTVVWGSAALLLSSTGLSTAGTSDCPNGFQVIELQPYEVICDRTTSASTRTRTYTVPFEPLGTNPPDQNGTPGLPNDPGKPQIPGQSGTPANPNPPVQPNPPGQPRVPGQSIVPGHPGSPNEPQSPPGVVTITITGIPPPLKTEGIPPPRAGFRTITKYVFPPPVLGITTSFVIGSTFGTTTVSPVSSCSGFDCIHTIVELLLEPSLSPQLRIARPHVVTTVPTTPPNTAITLTEVCTATTSCEPITITPPVDCVRPCTTTVITYPPRTLSFTTTPPDVITTITGTCTSTGSCEPVITIPPAKNCKHPCTTTVITYPPNTPSLTTTPPDVIITITEPCTSTGTCEPVVTVPPPSDCTRPCTTKVKVRPSTSVSLTTTPPPDVITTITEPCPSTGTCEPVVTVPPPSDCTRPCTTSVFVRRSTSSSEPPSTTIDGSSLTEQPSTTPETSSTQGPTTSEESTTTDETTTPAESTTSAKSTTTTAPTTTDAPTTTEESTTSDAPSTTTSETPPCTPGLEWAFYNFEQAPDGETNPGHIPYHPTEQTTTWSQQTFQIGTSLSGQSPGSRGTATTVGIPSQDQTFTVYGTDTGTNAQYNIVQHIGYFHPNKVGTYTFNLPGDQLDDVVYTWIGDPARSGYNNGNAYYIADYYAPTSRSFTFDVQNAGDYIPFRLSWVNAQQGGGFGFSVEDPDGNVILSDSTPTTDGQFVNGCADSVDAPPFDF
ncbi:hypothetical protein MRS44_002092 [Fusarium solani]|uniref:uncharacterized protein n=1 Tax=Fusarium solani TaxID=169388 RepID=UPI0032C44F95|nr:hypothetical protein MRS44_002092 [Fusarium solani]